MGSPCWPCAARCVPVTLVLPLSSVCSLVGWEPVVAGTMLAFVLAAVFVMVSVASRGMRLGARIPFAPFMLIGALLPTTLLE